MNINNIINLGKTCRTKSNIIELDVSKIMTTLLLDANMGLRMDLVSNDGDVQLVIDGAKHVYGLKGKRVLNIIALGDNVGLVRHSMQLKDAIDDIYYEMARKGLLSVGHASDNFGKTNDILLSTISNISRMYKNANPQEIEEYLKGIEDRVLKVNAFRKMVANRGRNNFDTQVERVLATTLGTVNYLTNYADNLKNPIANTDDITLDKLDEDIRNINRGVSYGTDVDYSINNYACARTEMEDRKAEYLAGLNYSRFAQNKTLAMSSIDTSKCSQMLDAVTETASHMQ